MHVASVMPCPEESLACSTQCNDVHQSEFMGGGNGCLRGAVTHPLLVVVLGDWRVITTDILCLTLRNSRDLQQEKTHSPQLIRVPCISRQDTKGA